MLAKVQANMGCKGMKETPIHKIGDELRFRSCIGNFVSPQVFPLLNVYRMYERGVMPYPGGVMEQPAKIIDVFQTIENHRAEAQERERAKANAGAGGKGSTRVR
jgi:hypothetical protein